MSPARFQVDLGGLIDLLSAHLYSGPQVYVRELLQNAVDAVTARRSLDPNCPATIRLWTEESNGIPVLVVSDTGIGLTAAQATDLLASIGASSKRHVDIGGRAEFIGQFGIGMLATFMVADSIEVTSRSAEPGATVIQWTGFSNGEFDLVEFPGQRAIDIPVGTQVRLVAKHGAEHWFEEETLVALASDYGALLPFEVLVQVKVPGADMLWRRVSGEAPWLQAHSSPESRKRALGEYCEQRFGYTPLDSIDLALPLIGLTGVAFVLPQAVAPAAGHHRVYLKGMLLGSRVVGLLPDWAFFVRAVVSTDGLTPAASREQLRQDDVLIGTRDALGDHLKSWAQHTLTSGSAKAREFIQIHHLALRALALTDDAMLDLACAVLPFETTDGVQTLREVADAGEVLFTSSTEAYRRVSTVARAQGIIIVNAGYVYDADILRRLTGRRGWRVRELVVGDIAQVLRLVGPQREAQVAEALVAARAVLAEDDCDVVLRDFEPPTVAAVLLRDSDGEHRRDLAREHSADPTRWGGLLDSVATAPHGPSRTLVLNDAADNVRRILVADQPEVFSAALRTIYLSAVLLAGEGLRPAETRVLNDSLFALLDAALRPGHEIQE